MSSLVSDDNDFAEESLVPPAEDVMVRGSSIPQGATPTLLDFGESVSRGMPLGSEVSSGIMSADQPVFRSIQAASFSGLGLDGPSSIEKGIANMSATVMQPGAFSFDPSSTHLPKEFDPQMQFDNKKLVSSVDAPDSFPEFYKYSTAPCLLPFEKYEKDNFQYSGSPEKLKVAFEKLLNGLEFDFEFNANCWEYQLESYPCDEHVTIQVKVYRDASCGHVVEFSRLAGRAQYRKQLVKVWNGLHALGFVSTPLENLNTFNGFVPDFECELQQVSKETINPLLKMVQSKMLDVSCTGAQLVSTAFKNPATKTALKESGAVGCLFSVLKASADDRVDQLVTAALRNASVDFHEDIKDEDQGIKYLVDKMKSCATDNDSLKSEVGRNCAKILIALAKSGYCTDIKEADGRAVATTIASNPKMNVALAARTKDLLRALNPLSR